MLCYLLILILLSHILNIICITCLCITNTIKNTNEMNTVLSLVVCVCENAYSQSQNTREHMQNLHKIIENISMTIPKVYSPYTRVKVVETVWTECNTINV